MEKVNLKKNDFDMTIYINGVPNLRELSKDSMSLLARNLSKNINDIIRTRRRSKKKETPP